jgi:hypothetical protein
MLIVTASFQVVAIALSVTASEARQSPFNVIASRRRGDLWDCFVANAPRKDEIGGRKPSRDDGTGIHVTASEARQSQSS